jgi:hypothetical protein
MPKGSLASAGPAGALTLTECLHRVGRAIYGGEWITGLSSTDRAMMIQYAGNIPPTDPVIRAEIERIRDRDGLASVQRSQALGWIRGCGFRTDAGARIDRVAFEQALSRDFGRHRLPIPEAGGLQPVASGITGAHQSARGPRSPSETADAPPAPISPRYRRKARTAARNREIYEEAKKEFGRRPKSGIAGSIAKKRKMRVSTVYRIICRERQNESKSEQNIVGQMP